MKFYDISHNIISGSSPSYYLKLPYWYRTMLFGNISSHFIPYHIRLLCHFIAVQAPAASGTAASAEAADATGSNAGGAPRVARQQRQQLRRNRRAPYTSARMASRACRAGRRALAWNTRALTSWPRRTSKPCGKPWPPRARAKAKHRQRTRVHLDRFSNELEDCICHRSRQSQESCADTYQSLSKYLVPSCVFYKVSWPNIGRCRYLPTRIRAIVLSALTVPVGVGQSASWCRLQGRASCRS